MPLINLLYVINDNNYNGIPNPLVGRKINVNSNNNNNFQIIGPHVWSAGSIK